MGKFYALYGLHVPFGSWWVYPNGWKLLQWGVRLTETTLDVLLTLLTRYGIPRRIIKAAIDCGKRRFYAAVWQWCNSYIIYIWLPYLLSPLSLPPNKFGDTLPHASNIFLPLFWPSSGTFAATYSAWPPWKWMFVDACKRCRCMCMRMHTWGWCMPWTWKYCHVC